MTAAFHPQQLERFRALVSQRIGFQIGDADLGALADTLRRQIVRHADSCDHYLSALASDPTGAETLDLARDITVGETYFFRNREQFDALREVVLPERLRARGGRRLRILSAGCASGEEAFSIAITVRELVGPGVALDEIVRAIDINRDALARAATGRFSSWALRDTPAATRERWFHTDGGAHVLSPAARELVAFELANLVDPHAPFWSPSTYDVVFCRNVMMYFSPEQARMLIDRIRHALAPGGYLFLGHAETLRGVSHDFHLRHTHGSFYYQGKEGHEERVRPPPERDGVEPPPPIADGVAWVDVIRGATDRVAALTSGASPHDPAPSHRCDRAQVLDLLARERFGEGLALMGNVAGSDPETLLLHAVLLAHDGRVDGAEAVCRRLLELDELDAGAHYVLALCAESSGDLERALDHDRIAIYLDPVFAMPRLHAGMLSRRRNDRAGARRELEQASILLVREDPARLLMFGGGFDRAALVSLCTAEIAACGGGR